MALQDAIQNFVNMNTGKDYIYALIVLVICIVLLKIIKIYVVHTLKKLAKKTKNEFDDYLVDFIGEFQWPFLFFISIYFAVSFIHVPVQIVTVLNHMLIIFMAIYITKGFNKMVDIFAQKEADKRREKADGNASMVLVLSRIIQIVVWVIVFLLVLSNLGFNITSLIAGLGVGGIAIAFALQKVLEDIFSSFSIYFDKPFEEGDYIIIGEDRGTVKKIGLKTTRIQHLQGQELVVSNRELTSIRIHNYKKMSKRRIVFTFGVVYGTNQKKLKKIPQLVNKLFDKVKDADLERVHFKEFGDFSLNFEVVYFVNTSNYNTYMDIQQEVNLGLVDVFEKEKIEFAFPTQTLHVVKK